MTELTRIYSSAKHFIAMHGKNAPEIARQMALQCYRKGDLERANIWKTIRQVIDSLQAYR